jgi:hypothetical protein
MTQTPNGAVQAVSELALSRPGLGPEAFTADKQQRASEDTKGD